AASLAAFFVALLWIVHPVHSAAVDYISGRADSLAFLFASTGWLLFLRAQTARRPITRGLIYGGAAISGLLSLCSREIGFVWLVLFVLHVLVFDRTRAHRRTLPTLLSVFVIIGLYAWLRQLPGGRISYGLANGWPASVRVVL